MQIRQQASWPRSRSSLFSAIPSVAFSNHGCSWPRRCPRTVLVRRGEFRAGPVRDTLRTMLKIRLHRLTALCVVIVQVAALPQRAAAAQAPQAGWDVAVYPILAWVPLGIGIDVDIPPFGGDSGGLSDLSSPWTWISSTDMPPSDAGSLPTCI